MLKEIHEQPQARRATRSRATSTGREPVLDGARVRGDRDLPASGASSIVACGTAYHAGLVGR